MKRKVSSRSRVYTLSLRGKLTLAFMLLIVLPLLTVSLVTTFLGFRDGRQQAFDRLDSVASMKMAEIGRWLDNLQTDLLGLMEEGVFRDGARLLAQGDSRSEENLERRVLTRFQQVIQLSKRYDELSLLSAQGIVVLSTDPIKVGEYRGLQPYFAHGLKQPGVHVQTVSYSSISEGLNNIIAVYPVTDEKGRTLGVVCGQANKGFLNKLMGDRTGIGSTGETYLVADNNVLMTVSRFASYSQNATLVLSQGIQHILDNRAPYRGVYPDYRQIEVIGVGYWLANLGVALVAEQNVAEAFRPVYFSLLINILIATLAAICAVFAGMYFSRSISRPIVQLSHTANAIAGGDMDLEAEVHRTDEIGSLASSFNAMTSKLKYRIAMETMVSDLSRRFIDLPLGDAAVAIDQALARTGSFVGADRMYILQLKEDRISFTNTNEWCREGIASRVASWQDLSSADLPWFMEVMASGEVVTVDDLASLPPEAANEKRTWQQQNVRSLLCVPLMYGKEFKGVLGVDAVRSERQWTAEDTQLLRLVGETICNTLERSKTELRQKMLEGQLRQSQKMQAVGTLAGGIAHDFNNLLQAIAGQVQLLLMKNEVPENGRKYLTSIDDTTQRAANLVKKLLTFSRGMESTVGEVSLNTIISDTLPLLERTIPRMVAIETQLAAALTTVVADTTEMEQVVMNLVTNAVDAMPKGGRLQIATENIDLDADYSANYLNVKPGTYVLLTVSDSGEGMDEETVRHIFEPFYTTKEVGRGTGLGLSIVFSIIKNNGGHITCYSQPGQGTTFNVYLPAAGGSAGETRQVETGGGAVRDFSSKPATVLVVDDEEMNREIARDLLEGCGYQVLTADCGEEALRIFQRHRETIGVVTLDLGMPGMGGEKCLQEMRKIDPLVKVVVATGYAAHEIVANPVAFGAAGSLGKPYRLAEMAATIRRVLEPSDTG